MAEYGCSSAKFCGPPSWSSPYRRICFQPPFQTSCSQPQTNCITTYSTRTGALYDAECASSKAINGQCASFGASYPQVTGSVSYDDLAAYTAAATGKPADLSTMPKCANGLQMVTKDGQSFPACPLPISPSMAPQCVDAFKTLWQCDRFKGVDEQKYRECKAMDDCFVYNAVYPNGTTAPIMVKANSPCYAAATAAMARAQSKCNQCPLNTC